MLKKKKATTDLSTPMYSKFIEYMNSIPDDIDLVHSYICVQYPQNRFNVRVDTIYKEGYVSEGVFYPYSYCPFCAVDSVDYDTMIAHEKKLLSDREAVIDAKVKKQNKKLN